MKKKKFRQEVPESVLFEILVRLPARSLFRFRAVSTSWRSLILDPYFIRSHCALAKTGTNLVTVALYPKSVWEGHVYDADSLVKVVGVKVPKEFLGSTASPSVHGLICLARQGRDICILNPSTWEYITVPLHQPDRLYLYHCLGFDPVANKHKIVFAYQSSDPPCAPPGGLGVVHWVLTLGSEEGWRRIPGNSTYHEKSTRDEVCIDGVIYVLAHVSSRGDFLAVLDLKSESFKLLELPDSGQARSFAYPASLFKFNGSVARAHNHSGSGYRDGRWVGPSIRPRISAWMLDDSGDEAVWKLRTWVLNLGPCWEKIRGDCRGLRLACSLRGGEVLVLTPIFVPRRAPTADLHLFFYNVQNRDGWSTTILAPGVGKALARSGDYHDILDIYDHVERLLPLGGSTCSLEGLSEISDLSLENNYSDSSSSSESSSDSSSEDE